MASLILAAGMTDAYSSDIIVSKDEEKLISIFTEDGSDIPVGPVLVLQRQDINGNWVNVSTPLAGFLTFQRNNTIFYITGEGTYRVHRKDISAWETSIGVQEG